MKTGKNHEYLEDSLQNIGKIQYVAGFFLEAGFFINVARREPRGRFSLRTTDYTVCALIATGHVFVNFSPKVHQNMVSKLVPNMPVLKLKGII